MKMLHGLTVILVVAMATAACTVHQQKQAIKSARYGLLGVGAGIDAADLAVDAAWGEAPEEDTDAYCKEMKASLVLEQALQVVYAGADAVFVWELALHKYVQAKGTPAEASTWASVLNSQAAWFLVASNVVGTIDAVRAFLELLGLKLPPGVAKLWGAVSWATSNPALGPVEWDWSSIKDSVCAAQP